MLTHTGLNLIKTSATRYKELLGILSPKSRKILQTQVAKPIEDYTAGILRGNDNIRNWTGYTEEVLNKFDVSSEEKKKVIEQVRQGGNYIANLDKKNIIITPLKHIEDFTSKKLDPNRAKYTNNAFALKDAIARRHETNESAARVADLNNKTYYSTRYNTPGTTGGRILHPLEQQQIDMERLQEGKKLLSSAVGDLNKQREDKGLAPLPPDIHDMTGGHYNLRVLTRESQDVAKNPYRNVLGGHINARNQSNEKPVLDRISKEDTWNMPLSSRGMRRIRRAKPNGIVLGDNLDDPTIGFV